MSNIKILVRKSQLPNNSDYGEKLYIKRMIEFVVGVKSVFAQYMTDYYNVKYQTAMNIIRIKQANDFFEVGIDTPEMYNGKQRTIVTTILKHDLGSVTEHIRPSFELKKISERLAGNIGIMWLGFLVNRSRSDDNGGK